MTGVGGVHLDKVAIDGREVLSADSMENGSVEEEAAQDEDQDLDSHIGIGSNTEKLLSSCLKC